MTIEEIEIIRIALLTEESHPEFESNSKSAMDILNKYRTQKEKLNELVKGESGFVDKARERQKNKNKKLDDIIDKVIRDAGGLDNFNLIEEEEKYDLIRKMMRMWKDYHIVRSLNRMRNSE